MRLHAVHSVPLQIFAHIIVRVMCRCNFPSKDPWMAIRGQQTGRQRQQAGRQAGEESQRASAPPPQPSRPDRDEHPAHPITRARVPGREQATFPRCDGSAAQAPVPVLVAAYLGTAPGAHNPILQPLHCLERARPGPWSPSSPRLLSPWMATSVHPFQPAIIINIIITTPRRIGTGQTGRDRARWSGPSPVSDHAPVRKR